MTTALTRVSAKQHVWVANMLIKTLAGKGSLHYPAKILFVLLFAFTAQAQTNGLSSTNFVEELKRLSFDELMQQPVTSVERRASTVGQSAAAVMVIDQRAIRRSGATTIPELLRQVPGMDVARINGNIWAVSARGFNGRFANKLLVQMDGRTLYNPLFAGVYWDTVDYPLEDIERIEVVRGPGASVWGANAVNGVINIITKSSNDTQGGLLSGGGGNEETAFGTVRYGAKVAPDLSYRVYLKAFDRDEQFSLQRDPNDQWSGASVGMRLDWKPNDQNSLLLEGGYLRSSAGQSSLRPATVPPFVFTDLEDEDADTASLLGRWIHQVAEDNRWTMQTYWNHDERDSDNEISNYRWDTFDVDFNHEFIVGERQRLVYGAGYRYIDVFGGASERDAGFIQTFIPPHRHLQLVSAFAEDQFAVVQDKFFLIGGSKIEHNDFTGVEIQPTGRLLWTPTTNQSAWLAVSRAVRTPSLAERGVRITGVPIAAPVFPQLRPNSDFESEELVAFELGYRAQITRAVSFDAALFHNVYDNLSVGMPLTPLSSTPPVIVPLSVFNAGSGETDGAEVAVTWQPLPEWRLYGAYTLFQEHLHSEIPGSPAPSLILESPQQQVFFQSSFDLPHDIDLDLIGRWVDALPGFIDPGTPAYFALDVRLAWRPTKNIELALVCQNVTDNHHQEFGSNPIIRTTVTEIERSIFAKLTWRF